ncbi:DUF1702 family protein [Streptomyces sp. NPDC017448]|uniref:DUF1702 family protein n=1 Tax=Streptomyces sp. NPDC017448 TaxID=3364996 RepID=UPI0037A37771
MTSIMGAFRRTVMAPSLSEVSFAGRGFDIPPTQETRTLESVPQAVVCGFEWAIGDRSLTDTERRLSLVDADVRGFAYEGATMACAIRDAMNPRGHRTRDLLHGQGGRAHIFLNYIGIGFAMARLPRPLWKRILPPLTAPDHYPAMNWLAVDGYGFDQAYFDTARRVEQQRRPRPYPWQGNADYFPRAADQGLGRALWFIHGARTDHVAAALNAFASHRHPDLWSGVGLAATFAGGAPGPLAALRHHAGPHAAHLAQGAVFAAKARHHGGHVPDHTRAALHALSALDVPAAAELADACAVPAHQAGALPAYEIWRRRVREQLPAVPL